MSRTSERGCPIVSFYTVLRLDIRPLLHAYRVLNYYNTVGRNSALLFMSTVHRLAASPTKCYGVRTRWLPNFVRELHKLLKPWVHGIHWGVWNRSRPRVCVLALSGSRSRTLPQRLRLQEPGQSVGLGLPLIGGQRPLAIKLIPVSSCSRHTWPIVHLLLNWVSNNS